ncbi:MAG: LptF/LptG family permease [Elusimicrobiales bacterium]|nr:LptF/LptG family permease [Elusimicrobiales bacterium]
MIPFLKIKSADKLILKYYFRYFISSLILFISIFFLFSFLQIINDKDISRGLSIILIIKAIIHLIPSVFNNSLVFSAVFSAFFTTGELSLKGETTALRCCGYSYYDIISKILTLTIISIPILYHLNHSIIPYSKLKSREYIRTMINRNTNISLKPNSFEKISSSHIISKDVDYSSLRKISIIRSLAQPIDITKKADFIIHIEAESGTYTTIKHKGILLSLNNGKISYINQKNPEIFYLGSFNEYLTFVPFEVNNKNYTINPKFISTEQLKKQITTSLKEKKLIQKEILSRTTSSISLFFITFLALTVAFIFERDSKYFSFLASIIVILMYYGVNIICDNVIFKKIYKPEIEIIPVLLISIFGILLYYKILRKK